MFRSVRYWAVDDLHAAREHFLAADCTHHRSPLRIDEQRQICQLTDPFGTIIQTRRTLTCPVPGRA